jgi:hypothetical protein
MPFGKHKGKPLTEIPDGYLRWCLENVTDCPVQVAEEAARRCLVYGFSPEQRKAISRNGKGLDIPKFMAETVGCDYERLRGEFDRAGGDPDECPFDTEDYQYMGPRLALGHAPSIVPSEFPKEYQ